MHSELTIKTSGQGLHEITSEILGVIFSSKVTSGLCVIFIKHTSASLIIQENADPSAKKDMEYWLNKLVPEKDPGFTHTFEGPDDMPSHLKAILTNTSLSIPIINGALVLGTWQGIYLWEHRRVGHKRQIVVKIMAD